MLQAGRYGYQPLTVSASATKAPISPFKARALSTKRGHQVTLFDADDKIGGQFNYAKRIPGKVKESKVLSVDNVIICAGQEPYRELYDQLAGAGVKAHLIGGADVAEELDAKRAIRQGTEVAAGI